MLILVLVHMPGAIRCHFKRAARQNRLTSKSRKVMHVLANKEAHRIEDEKKQHLLHIHKPMPASAKIVIDSNRLVNGVPDNPNFPSNVNNYNPKGFFGGVLKTVNSVVHGTTALAHNVIQSGTQLSTDLVNSQNNVQKNLSHQEANNEIQDMIDQARIEQHKRAINHIMQQEQARRGIVEGRMKGNGVIHVTSRVGY